MPIPHDPLPRDALKRAAHILGGRDHLARKLGVKPEDLKRWTEGGEPPPSGVVFAVLSILEADSRRS